MRPAGHSPWEYGAWVTFGEASEDARSGASPAPQPSRPRKPRTARSCRFCPRQDGSRSRTNRPRRFPGSSAGHPDASARRAGRARSGARQNGVRPGPPADASAEVPISAVRLLPTMAAKASLACTIVGPGASRSGLVRTSGVCGQEAVSATSSTIVMPTSVRAGSLTKT